MEIQFSYANVHYEISFDNTQIKAESSLYKGNFMKMKDLIETELLLKSEIKKNLFENEDSRNNHHYFLGLLQKMQQYLHMAEMAEEQGEEFPLYGFLSL